MFGILQSGWGEIKIGELQTSGSYVIDVLYDAL